MRQGKHTGNLYCGFRAMPIPDIAVITSFTFFFSVLYCMQGDADTGILSRNLFETKTQTESSWG